MRGWASPSTKWRWRSEPHRLTYRVEKLRPSAARFWCGSPTDEGRSRNTTTSSWDRAIAEACCVSATSQPCRTGTRTMTSEPSTTASLPSNSACFRSARKRRTASLLSPETSRIQWPTSCPRALELTTGTTSPNCSKAASISWSETAALALFWWSAFWHCSSMPVSPSGSLSAFPSASWARSC